MNASVNDPLFEDPEAGDDPVAEIERQIRRQRRRFAGGLLVGLLALLLLLLAVAPRLASLPPARLRLLSAINLRLAPRQFEVADWSLRWWGTITLRDVRVDDPLAGLHLRVPEATLSRGLVGLLPVGRVNPGVVTLQQPICQLQPPAASPSPLPPDSDTAAPPSDARPPAVSRDPASRRAAPPISDLACDLRINGGSATLILPEGDVVAIDQLDAQIVLLSKAMPLTAQAALRVVSGNERGGTLRLDAALTRPLQALQDPRAAGGRLELTAHELDLAAIEPLLRRINPGLRLRAGVLDGTAALLFSDAAHASLETAIEVSALQLLMPGETAPAMPPATARLALRIEQAGGQLAVRELALRSPWLTGSAEGQLETTRVASGLPAGTLQADLRLELQPLARDFRGLLRLRDDVRVDSGRLLATLRADADAQGLRLDSQWQTTNLLLHAGERPLRFNPPPTLALRLWRPHGQPWEVEQFDLRSSFAQLAGAGRVDRAQLSGYIDLTALARDAGFLFAKPPAMVGRIDVQGNLARRGEVAQLCFALQAVDLALSVGRARPFVLERGALSGSAELPLLTPAKGRTALTGLASNIHLAFGGAPGQVSGVCARVVWPATPGAAWIVQGGQLGLNLDGAQTAQALRPWLVLPDKSTVGGRIVGGVTCEAATGLFKLRFSGAATPLRLTTSAWAIDEPHARLSGALEAQPATGRLELREFEARCAVATLRMPHGTLTRTPEGAPAFEGQADLEGDLAAISAWRRPPREGAKTELAGKIAVGLSASTANEGTSFALRAAADDLTVTPPSGSPWSEPHAAATLDGTLTADGNLLQIARLEFTNSLLSGLCAGSITGLRDSRQTILKGGLAVDCSRVDALLRDRGIPEPILTGCASRPFDVTAPLAAGLTGLRSFGRANAAVHLASLEALGLLAGAADLQGTLRDGVLQLVYAPPLDEGRMDLRPSLEVGTSPVVLTLPRDSRLLRDVRLTDPLVRRLLGHINPLLGQCTVRSGRVSLTVDGARLPLDASFTRASSFDARIELRDVIIAPSGTLTEILTQAGLGGRDLTLAREDVVVTCRDGRITPSPHRATLSGHPILFKGTVGLDSSVAYRVEVPLTADLVGDEAIKYLKSRTLAVPVTGSVTQPSIDRRALAAEIKSLVAEATRQALTDRADDLIKRLREKVK